MPDEKIPVPTPAATASSPLPVTYSSLPGERGRVGYIPVPNLDRLMELRDALVALKGPLANDPAMQENVQELLFNAEAHERVLGKVSEALAPLLRLGPLGSR